MALTPESIVVPSLGINKAEMDTIKRTMEEYDGWSVGDIGRGEYGSLILTITPPDTDIPDVMWGIKNDQRVQIR